MREDRGRDPAPKCGYAIRAERANRRCGCGRRTEKGEHSLPAGQRASADPDYLFTGVWDELPIRYRVMVQLAHDDDQATDSSKEWPADRAWVDMGTIEMTGPDTERERDGDILVNDPMRLTDGIEPSDDPILHVRTYVYGESVLRRTGVPRPDTLG